MKYIISIIILFAFSALGFSQGSSFSRCNNKINLNVSVTQDPSIERLLCAHREFTENRDGIEGFRIQIFSDGGTQSRQRVFQRESVFNSRYPDVKSYVTYEAPDFKLRVGNFSTRLDAQRFLNQISPYFPSAYIVMDLIEFPDLDQ